MIQHRIKLPIRIAVHASRARFYRFRLNSSSMELAICQCVVTSAGSLVVDFIMIGNNGLLAASQNQE
jgi:hypothetical protein